jgi:hypothetical protein
MMNNRRNFEHEGGLMYRNIHPQGRRLIKKKRASNYRIYVPIIILSLPLLYSCSSNKNVETQISTDTDYLALEEEFLKFRNSTNNSCPINIRMPFIVDSIDNGEYIIADKFRMYNRSIEFIDNAYEKSISNHARRSFLLLFENYFIDTLNDWSVNIVLQKEFNNQDINLSSCIPARIDDWRREYKSEHSRIWNAFFDE